jgi:hypothetical protein
MVHSCDAKISPWVTGYQKPFKKISVHSVRVYANVSNAFVITKYKGMDPEIGSWNPLQAGWDSGYYPQPRGIYHWCKHNLEIIKRSPI